MTAEHRLARLTQLGMRQARYLGRAKTKYQLYLDATVANLTLATSQIGRTGNSGDDHPGSATESEIGGNSGGHRHPLLPCIQAWLISPALPLSLFPNRVFRPTF